MANYIVNKIVCTEEILNEYFLDYYPIDENESLREPYISFNKLFGVKSLNEYKEKYGTYIYYGNGFTYEKNKENLIEIKFTTRYLYPIQAIVKAIEMFKDKITWYVCEENKIYLSKFLWNGEMVQESTLYLENGEYYNWRMENEDYIEAIEYPDDDIWHYDYENEKEWKVWNYSYLISRYLNHYPAKEYYKEMQQYDFDDERENKKLYYFLTVKYEENSSNKEYNYISDDESIVVGDRVLVDMAGKLVIADVLEADYFTEKDAPFPVNRTKKVIKKVEKDFKIDDVMYNNNLKMNIDGTHFEFGIYNYKTTDTSNENWSDIYIYIHNSYFRYYNISELMTDAEIETILEYLKRLLNDELQEYEKITFYEPDLEFEFYPKINLKDTGEYLYIKQGYEIQDIFMKININLTNEEWVYTGQKYVIIFDRNEIERIKDYIEGVTSIK